MTTATRTAGTTPTPRPVAALAALVALLAATLLAAAPAAHAGDYRVSYCRGATQTPKPLYDWGRESTGGGPVSDRATDGCAVGSDDMALDWSERAPRAPKTRTAWALGAVGGNRIVRWEANSDGFIPSTNTWLTMTGIGECGNGGTCSPNTTKYSSGDVVQIFGAVDMDVDRIAFQLECRAGAGGDCSAPTTPPGGIASARLRTNLVTFRDPIAPKLDGVVSGSFVSGLPVSGPVDATATATDAGSGVQRIALVVDGAQVATSADRCTAPYDRQQPCPGSGDGTPRLDTTALADGTHAAQVTGVDASGNAGVLWSGQLLVSNGASRGPGTDVNLRGAPNGSYGADDARITTWWPATGRSPSTRKSVRQRCRTSKAFARRNRVACQGRAPLRSLAVSYSSVRSNSVAGRLVTKAGAPIAGATLRIVSTPRGGGSPAVVAQPVTDATGRFTAKVPVRIGSSRLAVDWLARVRDTVPAATTTLRRSVRAATTFSTSPRSSVRRGRTLTLRGTLRGPAGERKSNAIAVQANAGNGWRAVKTVRTGATGRWKAVYRVPRQLRGRYRFRAVVTPSAGYPYSIGTSASRPIRVR